ncbi:MAG: hypothetical protein ACNI25_10660 [Halarcobacter sp.]
MNKLLNIILLSIITVFLVSCGGGGEDGGDSSSSSNVARVELGPISSATVTISSLNGIKLDEYITNENGYFTPNREKLSEEINNYNPDMKYVRIISTGGIDIDPNDDEIIVESEKNEVKGQVTGILPISRLLENKEFRINAFTSVVEKSLKNTLNIDEEIINKILEENSFEDINNDGNITIDDIIDYKMSEHETNAEKTLMESWVPVITSGDEEEENNLISEYKTTYNLISPISELLRNEKLIVFPYLKNGYYIQYSIQKDYSEANFKPYYNGEKLTLNNYEVMYYQECSLSEECSKIQKIYFDGERYFVDYLKVKKTYFIDEEKITGFRQKEEDIKKEIEQIEEEIENIKTTELSL